MNNLGIIGEVLAFILGERNSNNSVPRTFPRLPEQTEEEQHDKIIKAEEKRQRKIERNKRNPKNESI